MNPIFAREVTVRWRSPRTFVLLFAFVLLLALGAGWIYHGSSNRVDVQEIWRPVTVNGRTYSVPEMRPINESVTARASRTGRELFGLLSMGNALAWLLGCAALTATGIARERERGLLEGLQLSPMRATSQIGARYGAALIFLFVLQLAALPVYGIAYTLGGVSPGEIVLAGAVITLTALWSAALGLWFSARAYRPSSAIFNVLGFLAVWSLFSVVGVLSGASSLAFWEGKIAFCLGVIHPWALLSALSAPERLFPAFIGAPMGFDAPGILVVAAIFYLVTALWLLCDAARLVNRALPPAAWGGRNRRIEKWKSALEARRESAREKRERTSARDSATGALLADLPIEKLARFRDPLLAREVRGRFRLRRATPLVSLGRAAVFLAGTCIWLWGVSSLLDAPTRMTWSLRAMVVVWALGVIVISVLSSTSFARERESGTWEGLRLSLLTPREIVRSKWASVLVSFAYYAAPLWLLLPLGLPWNGSGVAPALLGLSALVALTSLGAVCAFGLWVSWRATNPTMAIGWTLGIALFALGATGPLEESLDVKNHLSSTLFGVALDENYDYDSAQSQRATEIAYFNNATGENLDVNVYDSRSRTSSAAKRNQYDRQLERYHDWRFNQKIKAQELWNALHAWQPTAAFRALSGPSPNRGYEAVPVSQRAYENTVALSVGTSLLMLLLFGGLLVRAVRRERE